MDLKQYVKDATRTESVIEKVRVNPIALNQLLIGIVALGNMLDLVKKNVFYGKPISEEQYNKLVDQLDHTNEFFRPKTLFRYPFHPNLAQDIEVNPRLFHAIVGTITESAELAEALLKALRDEADLVNILEEFGDINWYEAIAVDEMNGDMEELLRRNIAKLKVRFPDKFTSQDAIDRDLEAERSILEGKNA